MRKSSLRKFGMYLPSRSITLTGIVTRVVLTRTISPSPTSSGPSWALPRFCVAGDCPLEPVPLRTGGCEGKLEIEDGGMPSDDLLSPTRRGRVCAFVCGIEPAINANRKSKPVHLTRLGLASNQLELE